MKLKVFVSVRLMVMVVVIRVLLSDFHRKHVFLQLKINSLVLEGTLCPFPLLDAICRN